MFGQSNDSNFTVVPTSEDKLYACVHNRVEVFARQSQPISIEHISAKLIISYQIINDTTFLPIGMDLKLEPRGDNIFSIEGITDIGIVEFQIELETGADKYELRAYPMRVRYGFHRMVLPGENDIDLDNLKEVEGLLIWADFSGLYARGLAQSYDLLYIDKNKVPNENRNSGHRLSRTSRAILDQVEAGDKIIIHNINYKIACKENVINSTDVIILNLK